MPRLSVEERIREAYIGMATQAHYALKRRGKIRTAICGTKLLLMQSGLLSRSRPHNSI